MTNTETTTRLLLQYFHSWQEPADYAKFRGCLADEVVFDSPTGIVSGADALTEIVRKTESPWRDVTLLASIFYKDGGALFYDGTDKVTGSKVRAGEYLSVKEERIVRIIAAICPVSEPNADRA